jgi:hypothetical protein
MRRLCVLVLGLGVSPQATARPACDLPKHESEAFASAEEGNMSAQEIVTQAEINAPPARVWALLTDFSATPSWNPFIRSIEGRLAEGERLKVEIQPPGQGAMTFQPVLLAVKPQRELRWLGSVFAKSLFSGEHAFVLENLAGERTRFTQSERFSGLLAPLIMSGARLQATRRGFVAMNEALKRCTERK